MLAGQPREVIDKFLYDVIKEVACTKSAIRWACGTISPAASSTPGGDQEAPGHGAADHGSIMDYNPVLFFKENTSPAGSSRLPSGPTTTGH